MHSSSPAVTSIPASSVYMVGLESVPCDRPVSCRDLHSWLHESNSGTRQSVLPSPVLLENPPPGSLSRMARDQYTACAHVNRSAPKNFSGNAFESFASERDRRRSRSLSSLTFACMGVCWSSRVSVSSSHDTGRFATSSSPGSDAM